MNLQCPRRALAAATAARRLLLGLCCTLPLAALAAGATATAAPPAPAASAVSPAQVFQRLNADPWIPRVVTFTDLGLSGPLVLGAQDSSREIALPVPPGVPLANATLQVDASFVRADGGRTTLILSLDGFPVSARPVTAERGDGSLTLAVDGAPRASGLVRFNVDWRTTIPRENTCSDGRTPGNLLRIEPTTRFTYRYDGSAVQDLSAAWNALPASPVIMIAGHKLSTEAYDSAWRIGVALERAGKRPRVRAMPAVGDTVDLQDVAIPTALRAIPAFAALADGGKRRIKDLAEVGALMALGQGGPLHADIMVADRATGSGVVQALDALRAQLPAEALPAFAEWRERALDGWGRQLAAGQVRVANVFGRPAIVVAPDAGADAAGLFSQNGQSPAMSPMLLVHATDDPRAADLAAVSLKSLGARPATLEVLSRADWTAGFDIGWVSGDGRGPGTLVIDVAAAPGAARTPPVVSVFMNEVLLSAREMEAHGKRERIIAPIPHHVVAARNNIRVSFVRQQASDRCREMPEPYPVSVLASSHLLLDKVEPLMYFSGLVSRFARGASVLVPIAYLYDAAGSLPRVISLAASTGVSPTRAQFVPVQDVGPPRIKGPFLSIDVPLEESVSEVKLQGGRLLLARGSERPLLDISGMHRAGLLEVVKVGRETGAIYRTLGREAPQFERALPLAAGNVAVIGMGGLRAEINTIDPSGEGLTREPRPTLADHPAWWLLPLLVLVVVGLLAGYAWWARRRRGGDGAA